LNVFKTITVQKNPRVLTGCKHFLDITLLSSQISTFGMVIVCTGTDHRRRSVEIYVGLSFESIHGDLEEYGKHYLTGGVPGSRNPISNPSQTHLTPISNPSRILLYPLTEIWRSNFP